MAAKIISKNFKPIISRAFRDYIKNSSSGDVIYAAVAFPSRDDYIDYAGVTGDSDLTIDSDTEGWKGRMDSDVDIVDEYYYSQQTISLHKLYTGGVSRVVKREDWNKGTIYYAWPNDRAHVMVKSYSGGAIKLNVYRCLFSPLTESTVSPSETFPSPISLSDGYVWKYLYTISDAEALLFMTDGWMSVPEKVTEDEALSLPAGSSRYIQYINQKSAVFGVVYNVDIDQDDSDLKALVSAGNVSVVCKDLSGTTVTTEATFTLYKDSIDGLIKPILVQTGVGYYGPLNFVLSTDTTTTVTGLSAQLPPGAGHGSNIPDEMFANDTMIVVRNIPEGLMLDLTNNNRFNVVNLVRNPIDLGTGAIATKSAYVACKAVDVVSHTFSQNDLIYNLNDEPIARVVAVNGNKIYYVNHKDKGEANTLAIGNIKDSNLNVVAVSATYNREVVFNSYDTLIVDYKPNSIIRVPEQTESFSFVVSF